MEMLFFPTIKKVFWFKSKKCVEDLVASYGFLRDDWMMRALINGFVANS
jgi:hypothetical protein